jgi:hypothetical protein
MNNRIERLTAFTEVVAANQSHLFEQAVKAAYEAGARHSDLLTAVDIARALATLPPRAVTRAYRVVDDWQWMGGDGQRNGSR